MATATLSGVPTTISDAESTSGWTGDTFSLNPDVKVEGSNSVECVMTPGNNSSQEIYYTGFTAADLSAVHLRLWFNISFVANLAASNPIEVFISDGTNTAYWVAYAAPGDYPGGWQQAVVYTGDTPSSGTKPTGNSTRVGMRFSVATRPRNAVNSWFDAWYYGDGFVVTGGTSGDELTWADIAVADAVYAYGIVKEVDGVYFLAGDIQIGDGTSTTYFKPESQIAVFKDLSVSASLYNIEFVDSASGLTNIDIVGGTWAAAGTQNYTITASDTDINSFSMDGVQISQAGLSTFHAGASVTNCVFNSCLQVDPSTATFQDNTFSNSVDTGGALLYPNTETNIKNLTFINCDNGVEMDSTTTNSGAKTSFSFDNFIFDDEAGNFDVNNTSGVALSVSKTNGTNANSSTGSSVTFTGAAVSLSFKVKDSFDDSNLQGARVLAWVTSNANNAAMPYDATVSITGSGTTATVAHTAHGMSSGDWVIISGANEDVYNGTYQITVTGANAYTYTTNETVASSPATGTIKSNFALLSGLTDVNGEITDSWPINSDQPFSYRIAKGTSPAPYFVRSTGSDTLSSTSGKSITQSLIRDQ